MVRPVALIYWTGHRMVRTIRAEVASRGAREALGWFGCEGAVMRRLAIGFVGLTLLSIGGRHAGESTATGTICPVPASPAMEAALLALELENGCLDDADDVAAPDSWPPGWDTATIRG